LTLSRWITVAGTIFQHVVGGASPRVWCTWTCGAAPCRRELRDQKLQLEREAEERNRELVELSTHLQNVSEREKAVLGANCTMNSAACWWAPAWIFHGRNNISPANDPDMKQRLHRVQQSLSRRRDLKRRIIEELRGRCWTTWNCSPRCAGQLKETCGSAGLR